MSWIPTTDAEEKEMLQAIGVASVDDLFKTIPDELRFRTWDVAPGRSEMSARRLIEAIGFRNKLECVNFIGGGFYDHFVPAAVDALSGRSEFMTAYTPYQPECSQGTLQSIYEYQSAICRLTNMEVANASLYDGGTAVFEAATMAVRLTRRTRVAVDASLNPIYRKMLETHVKNVGFEVVDGRDPADAACVIVQNPAYTGTVRDYSELAAQCHAAGALLVVSFYPISLGIVKTPGEMDADIAVAEGQCLGMPLSFGGPYLGIMATRKAHMRKMPGRLVAATQDEQGRRGFVLTLQAREQHIRREKAMSNICSNEALCALRALIYLSLLGKEGLREIAVQCHSKAEYLKARLRKGPEAIGQVPRANDPEDKLEILGSDPTFNEFAVRLPRPAEQVVERMLSRGYYAGLPLRSLDGEADPNDLLIAVTEKHTRQDLDTFAAALEEVSWS